MCGIAGIFQRDGAPVDLDVLVRMTRSLEHRGPDEEGFFVNLTDRPAGAGDLPLRTLAADGAGSPLGNVGLGHRRLSIIDLGSGQQPLCNEDGTIWISFNGEIYNFPELQAQLEAKGHRYRTHCDTESIVHAYEEWGFGCAERLRGMFSLAIWDQRQDCLYLARDRVGKKPMYYCDEGDRFLFASEMKSILEHASVDRDLDLAALSDYLSLLYVPSPRSILSSIRKLPAAHYAVVRRDRTEVRRYWDLPFDPMPVESEERVAEELLQILGDATRMRMVSEVPLGAFLSGGVDSSAVVALMAACSDEPVVTNSISFSEARYNEIEYARSIANRFETDHNEYNVSPDAIPVIEQLAWNYDEPFADSSAVPTYYVSKIARGRVTVSLSGDGGDENFAGYRRYYFDLRENAIRGFLPGGAGRHLFRFLGGMYPKADYLPRVFRGKTFISNLGRDPIDAYFFSVSAFGAGAKERLLNDDVRHALGDYRTEDLFREIYATAPAQDHLSRIQYLDIRTYLCEDILTKVDRASMAVSLEVRCPLLDHVFMEYAAKIPSRLKLSGREGKHILKKAFSRVLPDDVLYRRKMGFGVPILEWLRGECRDYAAEHILNGQASALYFRRETLDRIWREHQSGLRNWATELWIVLMFNLWYRRFVAGRGD